MSESKKKVTRGGGAALSPRGAPEKRRAPCPAEAGTRPQGFTGKQSRWRGRGPQLRLRTFACGRRNRSRRCRCRRASAVSDLHRGFARRRRLTPTPARGEEDEESRPSPQGANKAGHACRRDLASLVGRPLNLNPTFSTSPSRGRKSSCFWQPIDGLGRMQPVSHCNCCAAPCSRSLPQRLSPD